MEENREDSSPGLGRRSLKPARPLSMVLEENHDDDDNKNKNNANKTADGNVFINKTIITTTATQQLSSSSSSSSSSSLSSSTNSFPHATQGNGHNHHHYHNHKQQMTNKDDDDDGDDDVDKAEQQKGTGERGPEVPERKLRRVGVSLQPPLLSFESLLNDNDNDAGSGSGCGSGSGSGSADSDPSATIHVISSPCTSTNHYPSPRSQRRLFTTTTTTTTPPRKRKLSDNTLTLRKMPDANSSCGSCGEGTDSESEGDSGLYMNRLRDTATKLNLATRRPSYLKWRAKYIERQLPRDLLSSSTMSSLLPSPSEEVKAIVAEVAEDGGKLTKERKEKMDRDLKWIREQLVDLRRQDRSLAQQLLGIRKEMSSLRLAASCEEHQELLEDAQDEMEDIRELSRFVDFPLDIQSASPLRHIGVTKMNLSSRRFSTS